MSKLLAVSALTVMNLNTASADRGFTNCFFRWSSFNPRNYWKCRGWIRRMEETEAVNSERSMNPIELAQTAREEISNGNLISVDEKTWSEMLEILREEGVSTREDVERVVFEDSVEADLPLGVLEQLVLVTSIWDALKTLDTNNDGTISDEEWLKASDVPLPKTPDVFKDIFEDEDILAILGDEVEASIFINAEREGIEIPTGTVDFDVQEVDFVADESMGAPPSAFDGDDSGDVEDGLDSDAIAHALGLDSLYDDVDDLPEDMGDFEGSVNDSELWAAMAAEDAFVNEDRGMPAPPASPEFAEEESNEEAPPASPESAEEESYDEEAAPPAPPASPEYEEAPASPESAEESNE